MCQTLYFFNINISYAACYVTDVPQLTTLAHNIRWVYICIVYLYCISVLYTKHKIHTVKSTINQYTISEYKNNYMFRPLNRAIIRLCVELEKTNGSGGEWWGKGERDLVYIISTNI
jgi:hypothetical protein